MQKQKIIKFERKKDTFLVDGKELQGYIVDDRDYGVATPIHFVVITTNGKYDGLMVLYEEENGIFTTKYPINILSDYSKMAENLKELYFEYNGILYIIISYETKKHVKVCSFDLLESKFEIFSYEKVENTTKYKKLNFLQNYIYHKFIE